MKQQYRSYQETIEFLKEAQKKYPNLITTQVIGKTIENRDIMLAKISLDVQNADSKPALLYTGTIHAREWIGNELAIEFIDYLIKNIDSNPRVFTILKQNTLYMVPCLNPDGFEYSRNHFSFWRKNRRDNKNGTFGVDLNRNFSIGFSKITNTNSNVYSGPHPFSEPESKAIKEFIDSHENITIALDYHSQGNVFFPAHKFNHEAEAEGTDMNTLCANMNHEIKKITDREYGIHRGKPPAKLIGGSLREYCYSKGIIAVVVEVGTRNIPDYMKNMKESINENIPALLYALSEASNHSKMAPKMVEDFKITKIGVDSVTIEWDYEDSKNIFFKIYRNKKNKQPCTEDNLIAITKEKKFIDIELKSGTDYFYYIRAIDEKSGLKSPFATKLRVRTLLDKEEFSKTIFPLSKDVGYVAEKTLQTNSKHFGNNSLFVGVNQTKGISYAVMRFNLSSVPSNAIIKEAKISLYPMNRVNAKIEKYGEWSISFIDQESVNDITSFKQIDEAKVVETIGDTIKSEKLTQGIWHYWELNVNERKLLEKELLKGKVLFRLQGPKKLPLGKDSQMMMFDIGYGKHGGGIHYRPHLKIKYTIPQTKVEIAPLRVCTISKDETTCSILACGYDKDHEKIYGFMNFDLSSLPDPNYTVITEAYIVLQNKNRPKFKQDIRYNIEFIDSKDISYDHIKKRKSIEFIGYEIGQDDLKKRTKHHFIFDNYSTNELQNYHKANKPVSFLINSTVASEGKSHLINWHSQSSEKVAKLVIKYIKKRQTPPKKVTNLKYTIEKGMVKLTWDYPKDEEDLVGAFVVRHRFHPPSNPYDGVKLYAGKDNYTYDNFGSTNISKYYAVFTYDSVPNYSEAKVIKFEP